MLPSYKTKGGLSVPLISYMFCSKVELYFTLTLYVNDCAAGVNVPVPSNKIPSVSSNSCSVSSKMPMGVSNSVPCSSWILSLKVLDCSCATLITFSNVVVSTFVSLSQDLIVPVWPDEVKVLPAAKVPVTSLRTKCALNDFSGGLLAVYLNPAFVIFVA